MHQENPLVIITDKVPEFLKEKLQQKGYKVKYLPDITAEELNEQIPEAEGLILTTKIKVREPMLARAVKLKWIGRLGSGMDHVDVAYAESHGIRCITTPEGNRNAVAEHVLGLLLGLMNNIPKSYNEIRQGEWIRVPNRGVELSGKTVGIIGFGNAGAAVAKLLGAFDVTVLAYDKYKFGFAKDYIKEASFEQVCRYSDVISFHVPLTSETTYMADERFFASLEQRPYFINAARGSVTDTTALIYALKNNLIAGAALDVLENENLGTYTPSQREALDYLLQQPNVIITPHLGGSSKEAFHKMSSVMIEKLAF